MIGNFTRAVIHVVQTLAGVFENTLRRLDIASTPQFQSYELPLIAPSNRRYCISREGICRADLPGATLSEAEWSATPKAFERSY